MAKTTEIIGIGGRSRNSLQVTHDDDYLNWAAAEVIEEDDVDPDLLADVMPSTGEGGILNQIIVSPIRRRPTYEEAYTYLYENARQVRAAGSVAPSFEQIVGAYEVIIKLLIMLNEGRITQRQYTPAKIFFAMIAGNSKTALTNLLRVIDERTSRPADKGGRGRTFGELRKWVNKLEMRGLITLEDRNELILQLTQLARIRMAVVNTPDQADGQDEDQESSEKPAGDLEEEGSIPSTEE